MNDFIDTLIPITAICIGPVIVWIIFGYNHKTQLEVQKTVRAMIENGQTVPPDVMESLSDMKKTTPEQRREKDLRWGVVFTAIGIAMGLGGIPAIMYGQWDDIWDGGWFVLIFLALGIARLVLWKLAPGIKDRDQG